MRRPAPHSDPIPFPDTTRLDTLHALRAEQETLLRYRGSPQALDDRLREIKVTLGRLGREVGYG